MVGWCCPRPRARCCRAGKTVPLRGPRGADKRAHGQRCVHRRRRPAANGRGRALGYLAPGEFVGTPAYPGKQTSAPHRIGPAAKRRPARDSGRAHDLEGTRLPSDLGGALLLQTEQRQGLRDGRRRIPASVQHRPWHDQHHRSAISAQVSSTRDIRCNRLCQCRLRPKHLPHAQAVPVQPQSLS